MESADMKDWILSHAVFQQYTEVGIAAGRNAKFAAFWLVPHIVVLLECAVREASTPSYPLCQ